MYFRKTILFMLFFIYAVVIQAQQRKNIYIPDIPGYHTLKCDFHTHTVFSDGTVWPTVRVDEAWREGLDALAISDHIEYRPHSGDIIADHNRSFDVAKPLADRQGIILVRAAEITRNMPPGHLNVLFITNANLLERENVYDALKEAGDQGAFIFWNHPGWKVQQPDTTRWWDEHTRLLNEGLLQGIEVCNANEYYPEALTWSVQKGLAVLCNSDAHDPIGLSFDLVNSHRPMTLVFAKEKTEQSIKEALFAKRSVAYFGDTLMGPQELLQPLFFASLKFDRIPVALSNNKLAYVKVKNISDIDYILELAQPTVGFKSPENFIIQAHHTVNLELAGTSDEVETMKSLRIYYQVKNMLIAPDSNLIVAFDIPNVNQ